MVVPGLLGKFVSGDEARDVAEDVGLNFKIQGIFNYF